MQVQMNITIITLNDQTICLDIKSSDCVDSVKSNIYTKINLPVDGKRLISNYELRILDDNYDVDKNTKHLSIIKFLKEISSDSIQKPKKQKATVVYKTFGTDYTQVERGGGCIGVFHGYLIFQFPCVCKSAEINCSCVNKKKEIGRRTKEEFNLMGIPEYGKPIVFDC